MAPGLLTMWGTHLFDCAICERPIYDYPGRKGPDANIPPVCRMCERSYTPQLHVGTFMDRRIAKQICALADALTGESNRQQWNDLHGTP